MVTPLLPPKTRTYPFLGAIPDMARDPLAFLLNAALTHGRLVRLELGPRRMYLATHPDDLQYILVDNQRNFRKGPSYDAVRPMLGQGLVTAEGDAWLRQRRLMQPAFHRHQIANMGAVMVEATAERFPVWDAAARAAAPIDLAAEMMTITQTVIVRTMFGASLGADTARLAQAFDQIVAYLSGLLLAPIAVPLSWPTPRNRSFRAALALVEKTVYGFIEQRRQSADLGSDLLGMLLSARDAATGEGMAPRQIRDEVLTIFFAGHETTATTLSWLWHELGRHPEVTERVYAEIDAVAGGRPVTPADLAQMPYGRQVIDEALRLYPPAWVLARDMANADEVGGYTLPAGSSLLFSPYVTHRLPEFWPEPARFDPERFAPGASEGRHRYAYLPFIHGPRQCIGNTFALMEAQLVLATMAQRYHLRPQPGVEVRPEAQATLRPKPGVPVLFTRR